jgi:DNA anti-recombination protein RmuC
MTTADNGDSRLNSTRCASGGAACDRVATASTNPSGAQIPRTLDLTRQHGRSCGRSHDRLEQLLTCSRWHAATFHRWVSTRTERRRLARAIALADDVAELASELRQHSARIQHLQVQINAARPTPEEFETIVESIEATCRDQLSNLGAALADRGELREVKEPIRHC